MNANNKEVTMDQLKNEIEKIVQLRACVPWGSVEWGELNHLYNSLSARLASERINTLSEHIKNYWK